MILLATDAQCISCGMGGMAPAACCSMYMEHALHMQGGLDCWCEWVCEEKLGQNAWIR
jgi:hypothetical protein